MQRALQLLRECRRPSELRATAPASGPAASQSTLPVALPTQACTHSLFCPHAPKPPPHISLCTSMRPRHPQASCTSLQLRTGPLTLLWFELCRREGRRWPGWRCPVRPGGWAAADGGPGAWAWGWAKLTPPCPCSLLYIHLQSNNKCKTLPTPPQQILALSGFFFPPCFRTTPCTSPAYASSQTRGQIRAATAS